MEEGSVHGGDPPDPEPWQADRLRETAQRDGPVVYVTGGRQAGRGVVLQATVHLVTVYVYGCSMIVGFQVDCE